MPSSRMRVLSCVSSVLWLAVSALAADVAWDADPIVHLPQRIIEVNSSSPKADFTAALDVLSDPASWSIERDGINVPISKITVNPRTQSVFLETRRLPYFEVADIPKNALTVTYKPLNRTLHYTPPDPPPPATIAGRVSCLSYRLTSDKKKAAIDITGGLQAGVNAKPQYFWSAKADCPIFLGGWGEIGPSFSGEASQQRNADPDSLKAGITYRKLWPYGEIPSDGLNASSKRPIFQGIVFSADALGYEFERSIDREAVLLEGEIEERKFLEKNSNLTWTGMARGVFVLKPFNLSVGFIGFDAGKSLTRTVKADSRSSESQAVRRLRFDADIDRTFFNAGRAILTLHAHHTVRFPLNPSR